MSYQSYAIDKEVKKLADNIALARKRRNWSQRELAERLSVTRLTVRRLESDPGRVHLETLLGALNLFGLLEGFSEIANPYRDKKIITNELSAIKKKKSPAIKDDEVNF